MGIKCAHVAEVDKLGVLLETLKSRIILEQFLSSTYTSQHVVTWENVSGHPLTLHTPIP